VLPTQPAIPDILRDFRPVFPIQKSREGLRLRIRRMHPELPS
jgi:hypothetical protein